MTDEVHSLGEWRPLSPHEIAALFAPLPAYWWIAGGWAIDLFLGRQTRGHEDIDVQVLRRDQQAVRALLGTWDLQAALPPPRNEVWPFRAWHQGEVLDLTSHDIWCRSTPTEPWALQLMIADTREDRWLFRRAHTIARPLTTIGGTTPEGIPYLAPEIQLLYKARGMRPKDEADFAATLPVLSQPRRQWLKHALMMVDPQHPWLDRLDGA
jgi:hypothetical protein